MQRVFISLILLVSLSFVAGWYHANTDLLKSAAQSDNWNSLYDQTQVEYNATILAATLKSRNLFPNSFEYEQAIKQGLNIEQQDEAAAPEFPQIVSVGYRDRKPLVILRNADNSIFSAVPGDILDGGWQIETIDFNLVIAVLDGMTQEFAVVQYDFLQARDASNGVEGK